MDVLGVGSCSKRACHGSISPVEPTSGQNPPPIRRDEYITWTAKDVHARAYAVLHNERSRAIAKNLGGEPAHQNPQCLACHSTPTLAAQADKFAALVEDGVGCEACHGSARKWFAPHTSPTEWAMIGADVKERDYGFAMLDDVARRARVCAGCHVGSPPDEPHGVPARDANHEIMAAGHPRLVFELAVYQSFTPHWNDRRDKEPTFEARAWAVGQAAAAQASLELLAYRAGDAKQPWPEFAEYDCYSCHHGLKEPSWQRERGFAGRRPGSLPWGQWHLASLAIISDHVAPLGPEHRKALDELTRLMTRTNPDRDQVKRLAAAAAHDIESWTGKLAQVTQSPQSLGVLLRALAARDRSATVSSWDAAVQHVLAVGAIHRAGRRDEPTARERDVETAIEKLRQQLTFSKSHESPAKFQPGDLFAPLERLHQLVRDGTSGTALEGKR
jgi:hypothetical protein